MQLTTDLYNFISSCPEDLQKDMYYKAMLICVKDLICIKELIYIEESSIEELFKKIELFKKVEAVIPKSIKKSILSDLMVKCLKMKDETALKLALDANDVHELLEIKEKLEISIQQQQQDDEISLDEQVLVSSSESPITTDDLIPINSSISESPATTDSLIPIDSSITAEEDTLELREEILDNMCNEVQEITEGIVVTESELDQEKVTLHVDMINDYINNNEELALIVVNANCPPEFLVSVYARAIVDSAKNNTKEEFKRATDAALKDREEEIFTEAIAICKNEKNSEALELVMNARPEYLKVQEEKCEKDLVMHKPLNRNLKGDSSVQKSESSLRMNKRTRKTQYEQVTI